MDRRRGGRLVVMAGRGPRAGMAVTDAGLVSAGLAWAGRAQRGRTKRGTLWPCAWVHPAPSCPSPTTEPESQHWVINTSPGHPHHSGFITLFSALIPLQSADTALYWGWEWNWWWRGESSHTRVLFQGCIVTLERNNTGGVSCNPKWSFKNRELELITVLLTASIDYLLNKCIELFFVSTGIF